MTLRLPQWRLSPGSLLGRTVMLRRSMVATWSSRLTKTQYWVSPSAVGESSSPAVRLVRSVRSGMMVASIGISIPIRMKWVLPTLEKMARRDSLRKSTPERAWCGRQPLMSRLRFPRRPRTGLGSSPTSMIVSIETI